MTSAEPLIEAISRSPLIPVLRAPTPDFVLPTVRALFEAGVSVIELTYTTPEAVQLLAKARAELPADVYLGMGTVFTAEQAATAIEAGANFIVTPTVVPEVAIVAAERSTPLITGALTPTEVSAALALGATAVKVFPAGLLGPAYISNLLDVLPGAHLLPTGGVTADSASNFLRAGAIGVGIGGALLSPALRGDDVYGVARAAKQLLHQLQTCAASPQ